MVRFTDQSLLHLLKRPYYWALVVFFVLSAAQASDYTAYESYVNVSSNDAGQSEGLFFVRYDPIEPAVVGYNKATLYLPARSAALPARSAALPARSAALPARSAALPARSAAASGAAGAFEYVAFAKAFMAQHKGMLGVDSGHDFQLIREKEDRLGGRHLRFSRTYQDLEVDNMEVIVHFNPNRQITSINGEIARLDEVTKAAIDAHLANGLVASHEALIQAIAKSENLSVDQVEVDDIVALVTKTAPYVVWRLNASLNNNLIDHYTYRLSDESRPRILKKKSNIRH